MMKKFLSLAFLGALLVSPALAQTSNGRVTTADPTYVDPSISALSLTTAGRLRVDAVISSSGGGSMMVQGDVANGGVDSGNPVKIGCIFSSATSLPTVASGDRSNCQVDGAGNLRVLVTGNSGTPVDSGSAVLLGFSRASGLSSSNAPLGVLNYWWNGANTIASRGTTDGVWTNLSGTSDAGAAVTTAVTSAVANNIVAKTSAGNFYGANLTTGASAGYFLLFNATTAPADGAVTPFRCYVAAANTTIGINLNAPVRLSTGITMVFSTTGCFTKTASATAFMSVDYE